MIADRKELHTAALGYVDLGWPVFPCHFPLADGRCSCGSACGSPGKHPAVRNGLDAATIDPERLRWWWNDSPDAAPFNIGIRTGVAFDVVDIDDASGLDALDEAGWAAGDETPIEGPMQATSAGVHILVAPTGIGNRAKWVPGVDFRGDRGYIIGAPSTHRTGFRYRWTDDYPLSTPLAPLPGWAVSLIEGTKPEHVRTPPDPFRLLGSSAAGDDDRYCSAALAGELERLSHAGVGGRNHALNVAAFSIGTLVGRIDLQHAAQELDAVARSIGLGEREIVGTIRSGITKGAQNPRRLNS